VLESGGLRIDLLGSRVVLEGKPLELTSMEFRLLCLLVRNAGRVLSRNLILDSLWDGTGDFVDDNTLSVYIRRLREKLESDPSHPRRLATVRGFGYQWNEVHP
jgi:DNA-binding response OmpR family regulator